MSSTTNEINRVTTAIIRISIKLIIGALVILVLYEGISRGFAFGHAIFYEEAPDAPPGVERTVVIEEGDTASDVADLLMDQGLIVNKTAFLFQSRFYEYDTFYPGTYELNTSMTSKEILQELNTQPETQEDEEE